MQNIKFINNTESSHEKQILKLFKDAEEIHIAVGFFRLSGFNILKNKLEEFVKGRNKIANFYVGLGWGETEPKALKELYKTLNRKTGNNLVLCTPAAGIFHPKIYMFRTEEKVRLVLGSANMSKLGFNLSDEASVLIKTDIHSSFYKDVKTYLDGLQSKYFEDDVLALITRYEKELKNFSKNRGQSSKFKFRRNVLPGEIDQELLQEYYEEYLQADDFVQPKEREQEYAQAKENLLVLASEKQLSQSHINELFGQLVGHAEYKPKLWHSGSIHRTTYKTLEYPTTLRKIAKKVSNNIDKEEGVAFQKVVEYVQRKFQENKISGIGKNIITEMLMSFEPQKFANLNKNPLAVLEELGKTYPNANSFNGETYKKYVKELKQIRDFLGMDSFLEIDSFFNYVYWILKEESHG